MNSEKMYNLRIKVQGPMADFAHLTIYNGYLESIYKGYGIFDKNLPGGIYKVELALNNRKKEQIIKLDEDKNINLEAPKTSSSAIAAGFQGTHEYYSEPAHKYAMEPTVTTENSIEDSSLFLFFRYTSQEAYAEITSNESLGQYFSILDSNRMLLYECIAPNIREEINNCGWMAFSGLFPPGNYYLHYKGRKKTRDVTAILPREIPIRLCKEWQTQVYMTFGNGPLFQSLLVSFKKLHIHSRDNEVNSLYYIEGILQKFINGIYYLPKSLLEKLAHGKWENPMLGILAAHAYFTSGSKNQDQLFSTVLRNLEIILGEIPDVRALKIMQASHAGLPTPVVVIEEPCMLLTGMKAMIRPTENTSSQQFITPFSLADKAVPELYPDMAFTSYKPFAKVRKQKNLATSAQSNLEDDATKRLEFDYLGINYVEANKKDLEGSKIRQISIGSPARKPLILNSWVANSLMEITDVNPENNLNINGIASQLDLTPSGLTQTIRSIVSHQDKIIAYTDKIQKGNTYNAFSQENIDKLKSMI